MYRLRTVIKSVLRLVVFTVPEPSEVRIDTVVRKLDAEMFRSFEELLSQEGYEKLLEEEA